MLTKRIIALILCSGDHVVQSVGFKHTNAVGNAKTAMEFYSLWDVDEMVILNIGRDAQKEKFFRIVENAAKYCFLPLTVGGWLRTRSDVQAAFDAGADKVLFNTAFIEDPDVPKEAAEQYGKQAVVAGIDHVGMLAFTDRGRKNVAFDLSRYEAAGEIMLQSIERDGRGNGYDRETLQKVISQVTVPVVAAGGCGCWEDMAAAIESGASAVAVGNLLHFKEHAAKEAKEYLIGRGFNIRPPNFFTTAAPRQRRVVI